MRNATVGRSASAIALGLAVHLVLLAQTSLLDAQTEEQSFRYEATAKVEYDGRIEETAQVPVWIKARNSAEADKRKDDEGRKSILELYPASRIVEGTLNVVSKTTERVHEFGLKSRVDISVQCLNDIGHIEVAHKIPNMPSYPGLRGFRLIDKNMFNIIIISRVDGIEEAFEAKVLTRGHGADWVGISPDSDDVIKRNPRRGRYLIANKKDDVAMVSGLPWTVNRKVWEGDVLSGKDNTITLKVQDVEDNRARKDAGLLGIRLRNDNGRLDVQWEPRSHATENVWPQENVGDLHSARDYILDGHSAGVKFRIHVVVSNESARAAAKKATLTRRLNWLFVTDRDDKVNAIRFSQGGEPASGLFPINPPIKARALAAGTYHFGEQLLVALGADDGRMYAMRFRPPSKFSPDGGPIGALYPVTPLRDLAAKALAAGRYGRSSEISNAGSSVILFVIGADDGRVYGLKCGSPRADGDFASGTTNVSRPFPLDSNNALKVEALAAASYGQEGLMLFAVGADNGRVYGLKFSADGTPSGGFVPDVGTGILKAKALAAGSYGQGDLMLFAVSADDGQVHVLRFSADGTPSSDGFAPVVATGMIKAKALATGSCGEDGLILFAVGADDGRVFSLKFNSDGAPAGSFTPVGDEAAKELGSGFNFVPPFLK